MWSDAGVRALRCRLVKILIGEGGCMGRWCMYACERVVGELVLILLVRVVLAVLLCCWWGRVHVRCMGVGVRNFVDGPVRFALFVDHGRARFYTGVAHFLEMTHFFAITAFVIVWVAVCICVCLCLRRIARSFVV